MKSVRKKKRETHRFRADDADVVFMCLLSIKSHIYRPMVKKCAIGICGIALTLSDEEPNANTGEVEAVQPRLHVQSYVFRILTALPLEDALCDGGYGGVVSGFDVL